MQVHRRTAQLLYFPAYLAEYQYGTRYKKGTSGVTVPHMFQAVVGGTRTGQGGGRSPCACFQV